MSRVSIRATNRLTQKRGDKNRNSHHRMLSNDGMPKFNGKKRTELDNAFMPKR